MELSTNSDRTLWWRVAAIGCVALGCLPLVAAQFLQLLAKPHYQFAALVPIGVWWLWREQDWHVTRRIALWHWAPLLLFLLGTLGLGAASWVWSPWLGTVAALLLVLPCLWWLAGFDGWIAGWRGWLFGWTFLPLPFNLDAEITTSLRTFTTRWTSWVLDELHVKHLSYANIIELPGKPLFVADACSGINSLFVMLAAAMFIAMKWQRNIVHVVCLLIAAFLITLLENITRLTAVAYLLRWQIDLSEGPDHAALGGVLFVVSLLLLLSADQLLMFLLPLKWLPMRLWFLEPEDVHGTRLQPYRFLPASLGQVRATFMASLPILMLGAFQLDRMPAISLADAFPGEAKVPDLGAELLPAELEGFRRTNYEKITRVVGDPLGRDSQQWTYERHGIKALISVDYPYEGLHDLCVCYKAAGWSIPDKRVIPSEELQAFKSTVAGPLALGTLHRPLYGYALLLFSLADRDGKVVAIIKELADPGVTGRAGQRFSAFATSTPPPVVNPATKAPYIQFQMMAHAQNQPTDEDVSRLMQVYLIARDRLHAECFPQAKAVNATSAAQTTGGDASSPATEGQR